MRHFHSYGPVDPELHFCVERRELVETCVEELVGDLAKGGHYFTIWAPRQSGKTWLMWRAVDEVRRRYGDRFAVGKMSMQSVILEANADDATLFGYFPGQLEDAFGVRIETPRTWQHVRDIYRKSSGVFNRPVILLIDEFDKLPPPAIDRLVSLFRDMYLDREAYWLHGLALVGVRAVLGVMSERGSPFNIQRSLHVPNLSLGEVAEMFRQYSEESGQAVLPEVVEKAHDVTAGQPGLVGWLGELITEKYNPGKGKPIDLPAWSHMYLWATRTEFNNTTLNLVAKVRARHTDKVLDLFRSANVPFSLEEEWCSYLYFNGIITPEPSAGDSGQPTLVCRFANPFAQLRIYNALTQDLTEMPPSILPLEPLDDLSDVLLDSGLDVPGLLRRYCGYLARLRARGLNPWKDQPRRDNLHITEAVGHFHLYAWLLFAVGPICTISPEFPTGNGKVDLVVRWKGHTHVIEVKSFTRAYELPTFRAQAAGYAKKLGLSEATLVLFIPGADEAITAKISSDATADGVAVHTVAIGW